MLIEGHPFWKNINVLWQLLEAKHPQYTNVVVASQSEISFKGEIKDMPSALNVLFYFLTSRSELRTSIVIFSFYIHFGSRLEMLLQYIRERYSGLLLRLLLYNV